MTPGQELRIEGSLPKLEPTREGERLMVEWTSRCDVVERAARDLNRAEIARLEAEAAFAAWLLPEDATDGEVFSIWCGSKLIQVTRSNGRIVLTIRARREVKP